VSSPPPAAKRSHPVALIACIVLSGLAAGAFWGLLSLFTDRDTTILLVAFAVVIGMFMRWQGFANRSGAIGAVVAVAIAFVYAQYLFAAMRMADMLGFPLRDTLFKMDVPFAWRIVQSNLDVWDIAIFILAGAVAAWTTARRAKN
jgi:hypothetical protein